jgi:2-amino-4-hydroxy-6-hydroxymethyldihydropteridine diphosphokinase
MIVCYLGLGSNLGNRGKNIRSAIAKLRKLRDTKVIRVSRIIQSKPAGAPAQRYFLNGAIKIKTALSALHLLKALKNIEKELGRKKSVRNGPRTIDLDILLYGEKIISRRDLSIPHPRLFARHFVIRPLLEIICR